EGHIKEEEEDKLYRDVNINQGRGIQANLEVKDSHVTLTLVNPDGQQQSSSVSSQFVTSMLNLTLDVGMESIFETTSQLDVQTPTSMTPLPMTTPTMTPFTIATIITPSQAPILPTTVSSNIIQNLPNFSSLFLFDDRLRSLEANFSEFTQMNQFVGAVSTIIGINEEPSAGPDRGSKRRREGTEPDSASALMETATRSTGRTSYAVAADLSKMELNKILIKKMEGNKSIQRSDEQRNLYKALLKVDTLTPELLAEPTYELMKGSCKSLVELEYHLEEVFKAKTDQLDWVNSEGQQYPHSLLKPLPLIPNNQGHRVIPYEHFINNDLEYLRGGASSHKYTTSITKTKAADYGHIKWIEDLVPRTMWIEEPIGYDKHALWIRRVEDLQLGVKSYQKKLNLTKPNSDGTLIDVRTALDDRLKGIRMQYLPQSIWRKSDKDRAAAMIQAIDKRLKTRRIMRSLERFVGGRKLKDGCEGTWFQLSYKFITTCSYPTITYKDIIIQDFCYSDALRPS
nr:hypothetical protein [Tanacetum cinerariifolium]